MRNNLMLAAAGLLVLIQPTTAWAEEAHAATCPVDAQALPAELASWNTRTPFAAGKSSGELAGATLEVGKAVDAALVRTPEVKYDPRPEKPGGSVSYGGLFAFVADSAGTFRVALGSGAWIDVISGGQALESSAHGHGPDCSGVRKMVDFNLEAGTYTLQIAANGQPNLALLVTRLP